jgi:hypothetical protein
LPKAGAWEKSPRGSLTNGFGIIFAAVQAQSSKTVFRGADKTPYGIHSHIDPKSQVFENWARDG